MLDIKRIRNNPEEIIEALKKRRGEYPIQKLLDTDEKRREVIQKVESMKAEQNKLSKQVPQMKKNGEDTTELFKNLKKLSDDIKSMDDDLKNIDEEIREYLMEIPNTPNKDVPVGLDDTENLEMRKWENLVNLILILRLTGIWALIWIFWISKEQLRFPNQDLVYSKEKAQDLKEL